VRHFTSPRFWACYEGLPANIRALADRSFEQLKADPRHPSLHFKQIGEFRSVRVGGHYRALAIEVDDGLN
jgi:hypothetical protein